MTEGLIQQVKRAPSLGLGALLVALAVGGCSGGQGTGSSTLGTTPVGSVSESQSLRPTVTPSLPPIPGFRSTGSMSIARGTATLLSDGRVLMVGGFDKAVTSAEVYNPTTGTFSPTGSMASTRMLQTATLLSDGRVLIAGGTTGLDYLESAELYNPTTGTFGPTGSMAVGRWGHSATLLTDGRVLIAGGWGLLANSTAYLRSAELYDPKTGIFSTTGSMVTARSGQTANLLSDGRVLVAGGAMHTDAAAELYDPTTGTFSPSGSMTTPRSGNTATLLSDGRVLIAGGYEGRSISIASAELYDPKTGTFSPTGSMTTARDAHSATLLSDGRVLVAGGGATVSEAIASAEMYDPKTGTFSPAGSMTTARIGQTATLLSDGRVLLAGGRAGTASFASAELYQP
jgi:hypothetical protein